MSRIKEPKFGPECFSNFTWVGCDVWRLWRYGNKNLHKEVARRNIRGIERTNEANLVLRVCGVKAELFMEFADGRLHWRFVPL
jgi:hypothetical protein